MSRFAAITLAILFCAPLGVAAEPIRVAPVECPIPADIAPLVSDDVSAYELNSCAGAFDDLFLYQNLSVAGGALVLRVFPDPDTGRVDDFPTAPDDCPSDAWASQ